MIKKEKVVMTRRQQEREARLARFVACAKSLLAEKGYDGMSVDELARNAEFTKRVVYSYFKDKREVFLAVVLEDLKQLREELLDSIDQTGSAIANIESVVEVYLEFARRETKSFQRMMEFEAHDYFLGRSTVGLNSFCKECIRVHDETSNLVVDLLDSGIQDGSVTSEYSAVELMLSIWGAMVGNVQIIEMRKSRFRSKKYSTTEKRMYEICKNNLLNLLYKPS